MSHPLQHLVFYDGQCGLCDRMVQFLLRIDRRKIFAFAPLQGKTASQYLRGLPVEMRFTDSFILIEDYRSSSPRVYMLARGVFRVAWLLRWPWLLIGWLFFLPGWMFDWVYRLVAQNRHYFFSKTQCRMPPPNQKERFLP